MESRPDDQVPDLRWGNNYKYIENTDVSDPSSVQTSNDDTAKNYVHKHVLCPILRLSNPWPELISYARAINLKDLSDLEHKHVPYG